MTLQGHASRYDDRFGVNDSAIAAQVFPVVPDRVASTMHQIVGSVKLTLRATRTEPAGVAVAVLGGRGRAAIVDARALNTAVRVVQAFLLKFAPCTVIQTIASASTQEISAVTAAVFSVARLIDDLKAQITEY